MRTLFKIFIMGGFLLNTSCGLIDGELLRPIGKIDAGSATPDGGDSTAPLLPPTDDGGGTTPSPTPTPNAKINVYRPNGVITKMVVDSLGRRIYVGDFTEVLDYARGIISLNEDGTRNASFNEGLGAGDSSLRVVSGAFQPDGKLIVVGRFNSMNGAQKTGIMRLKADGSPDSTFQTAGTSFTSGQYMWDMALQDDGKILLVGGGITGKVGRVNSDGTLDTDFATNIGTGAPTDPNAIEVQADGKILVGGNFTSFNGTPSINRLVRLNSNGTIDSAFSTNIGTGFDKSVNKIKILSDGKIMVAGKFSTFKGVASPPIVRLNSDGTLDNSFTGAAFLSSSTIDEFAFQADGKLIIAGNFTGAGHHCLARLDSTGAHDASFDAGTVWDCDYYGDWITSLNVRPNGQILVGGNKLTNFDSWNDGVGIIRHNSDGSVDNSFQQMNIGYTYVDDLIDGPDNTLIALGDFKWFGSKTANYIYRETADGEIDSTFQTGTGFDNGITALAILPDNSIVVGGGFSEYNGTFINRLAKILPDGTLDTNFNVGTGVVGGGWPQDIAIQDDGKIVVAGGFTSYNSTPVNRLMRLDTNGNLDTTFTTKMGTGVDSGVNVVKLVEDGNFVIAGEFTSYNGTASGRIAKIKPDGELDTSFSVGVGFSGPVNDFKVQSDGKIIAVGSFATYKGASHSRIARLETNGDADATFTTGTGFGGGIPQTVTIQNSGKILVGGYFTSYNGTSANYLTRLNTDGSIDGLFNIGTGFDYYIKTILNLSDDLILAAGENYAYQNNKSPYLTIINDDGSLFVEP